MKKIPVLILAGSRLGERDFLAQEGKVLHKALLPIEKTPMIERVYNAIRKAGIASEIYIASENNDWIENSLSKEIIFFCALPTLPETMQAALEIIGFPCLIVTADHALLRSEWLLEFLSKSEHSLADLTFGIALKEKIEALPIQTTRTYINLSDIQFSGCNLFLLKSLNSKKIIDLWAKIHHLRKSPLRMVRILGVNFLLKALLKKLDSKHLLQRIHTLTGASLGFIQLEDGRAALDVDTISDWKLVEALIRLERT